MSSGVPDLCFPMPFKDKHGLYIELKRQNQGTTSLNQKNWLWALNSVGYLAVICYGFDEAKKVIMDYFDIKD